ncbi:Plant tudor-like RNA-binding protein [Melia azedarach]|uniref:Plant tudor-like RNA-binding protein n=1 Tax=Melia azedarach TaxID=155640 RepID=A0ACC1YV94_MELAZ|nr:Plant tudor-like RNA-binding protein [Melia azedarach]
MTKFRNGNSVEALRREHDPCGSWFPASVVSVDGNEYVVRYKFLMDNKGEPVLEKVHGEGIRPPPPPPPQMGKRWKVGDIAEVFDNQCWRIGKIAKVLQKNWFVIRLFGSIRLKEFHETNIRIRKSWHNNKWSVIGKDKLLTTENDSKYFNSFSGARFQKMGTDSHLRKKDGQRCHAGGNNDCKMDFLAGTVRRCHADSCKPNSGDLLIGGSRKKRKSSPLLGNPPLLKQVVDVSSPRATLDEKLFGGSSQMDAKMVKATTDWYHVSSTPCWSNEDSNQCSVASCSSNEFADYPEENFHKSYENISNNSDAESSFPTLSRNERMFPSSRQKLEVDIHELELHAYESTVQALYASGPLSWEQESLLTNLRLSLNISDEEHLLQLRHLLSAQVV